MRKGDLGRRWKDRDKEVMGEPKHGGGNKPETKRRW